METTNTSKNKRGRKPGQGRKPGVQTAYCLQREDKIMHLLADGFSHQEIAARLFICPEHLSNITYEMRKKASAKTTIQMVVNYFRQQHEREIAEIKKEANYANN